MNTINTIRSRINFPNTIVTPEIVSISTPVVDELADIKATVTAYAIKMIADKKSYQHASNNLKNTASDYAKEVLKETYIRLIKRADNSAVTDLEKFKAKELITKAGT
jgi:hypothetical protein